MTFEAIHRSSAPEMVAEQIVDQITTGELPPGTRLPAQRDLARMLGVGRSSVREAISALAVMGYPAPQQGRGTFIETVLPEAIDGGDGEAAACWMSLHLGGVRDELKHVIG